MPLCGSLPQPSGCEESWRVSRGAQRPTVVPLGSVCTSQLRPGPQSRASACGPAAQAMTTSAAYGARPAWAPALDAAHPVAPLLARTWALADPAVVAAATGGLDDGPGETDALFPHRPAALGDPAKALRLMPALDELEYLLSEEGQTFFVNETFEYPVVDGIADPAGIPPLDELDGPDLDLTDLRSIEESQALLTELGLLS